MKVATKLTGGFALHIAILVGLLVYHVRTIRDTVSTSYELSEISSRLYVSAITQLGRIAQLEENASKYGVTRDEGYLDKFNQIAGDFDAALLHLDSLELSDPERAEVAALAHGWVGFQPLADRLRTLIQGASPWTVQDSLAMLHQHLAELRLRAQRVADASQAVMEARLERSANAARDAERLSWGAAAGALLLGLIVSGLIVRSIADQLARLKKGTREVADGNFDYRLDASRGDEFAQVARDFNTMTQRLGELDRMKEDFISKISHDLKTPLASMQETTSILLDEVPGALTEKQRWLLLLNHQSGQRLSAMIAKLLDLSALEAGALRPVLRTHDLVPLVRHAVQQLEPAATDRGLRLELAAPDRTLLLDCDAERIHQLLENLLENALKFSPDDGAVRTAVEYCEEPPPRVPPERWHALRQPGDGAGAILITVVDHGPGVPDEEKERIFDRFVQSEAGRKTRGRGVGLGLTICREIVAAHEGAIWVGDNPGGGSIFHVLLPDARRAPIPTAFATQANGHHEETPHET